MHSFYEFEGENALQVAFFFLNIIVPFAFV